MPQIPTETEIQGYFESLSNWGRWGADDRLGTLNLITNESRKAAAGLVQTGEVVSLSRDIDPNKPDLLGRPATIQRFMMIHSREWVGRNEGVVAQFSGFREFVGIVPHGTHTHIDGLAHVSWEGMYYNGVPDTTMSTLDGSTELSLHQAHDGVVGRGVVLDIPALTGRDWLEPGEQVFPEHLEQAEQRQGVRVGEGDILMTYTGNFRRITAEGAHPQHQHPGYSAACLPWFHDRGIALLSSDTVNDSNPSGYPGGNLLLPVHAVALVAMGLWMIDNMEMELLIERCRALGRWDFLTTIQPWRFVGITAAPVNPIAMF